MESCGVSEYCISSKWKRNPVTVRSECSLCRCLMADLFLDTTLFLFCILHSPSICSPPVFSGYPPVSQWLDHFGPGLPACGHLFTSSSISRHGCKPPYNHHHAPPPLPSALLRPSLVFPPDTSCEPLMLILQSTPFSLVIRTARTVVLLASVLCSKFADPETSK